MCSSFRPTFSPTLPPTAHRPTPGLARVPPFANEWNDRRTYVGEAGREGVREGGRGTLTFLWQQLSISEVHFAAAAAAAAVAFRSVEFLAFSFSFSFSLSSFVPFSFRSPPPPPSFFAFVGKWEREGRREGGRGIQTAFFREYRS